MSTSYDVFTGAFLSKVSEYELTQLEEPVRTSLVDGYLKRAVNEFAKVCLYDLTNKDDELREFSVDISDGDLDEIAEIISEGMVVQWLKPYLYRQEILENALSTRDFSTYSPAELLKRVGSTYEKAKRDYTQMVREYSYNHGDLSSLHL